jgi:hypothetical protein
LGLYIPRTLSRAITIQSNSDLILDSSGVHSTAISIPQQILQFGSNVLNNRKHKSANNNRPVIGPPTQGRVLNTAVPAPVRSPSISTGPNTPPAADNIQRENSRPGSGSGRQSNSNESLGHDVILNRSIKFQVGGDAGRLDV